MKRESIHYRLAKLGNSGNKIYSGDMSICEYTRKVIFGGILLSFFFAIGLGFGVWIVMALYEIMGTIMGFAVFGPAAATFSGCLLLLSIIASHSYLKNRWKEKSRDLLKKENKSFISSAYKSYKDKVCFTVDFEEK